VRAEQPLRIVPLLVDLDQADALGVQGVQLALVALVGAPQGPAGVFAQVVDAVARQVVDNQMLPHASADRLAALGDVLQAPAMIGLGVRGEDGGGGRRPRDRRLGRRGQR